MADKMIVTHKHYTMGRGAYRLVGIWSAPAKSLAGTNPSAYNIAMDTRPKCCNMMCDHCGTGIIHHFIIKDEDGKEFSVGSSCIDKLGQQSLVTEAKAAEKERQRQLRQAKAEKKRQERHEAYLLELQSQREANGGLTNKEVISIKCDELNKVLSDKCKLLAEPITSLLEKAGGNFCESVISSMEAGKMPHGNGKNIVIEIMTKQQTKARKNSKAYAEAHEQMKALFTKIEENVTTLRQSHQQKLEKLHGFK